MNIGGEGADDNPGTSVAMSSDGMRVIIGALHIMTGSMGRIPHPESTRRWMGIGSQVGMDIDGEDRFDRSGCSVTMSSDGTSVIVGGHHNGGVDGCSSGHARVFSSISSSPPPSLLSSSSSSRISSPQKGF